MMHEETLTWSDDEWHTRVHDTNHVWVESKLRMGKS